MIKFGPYMERAAAKERGWLYYMTGRPCKNGHVDKKMTSSNKCASCLVRTDKRRAYEAAWKRKKRESPEFVRLESQRRQEWISKPGVKESLYERNAASARSRYANDPEWRKARLEEARVRSKEKPEQARARSKRHRDKYPDKVKAQNNSRRVHRSITRGKLKDVDIREIFKKSFGFCVYCSAHLFDGYHLDHIMPISLGGGNSLDNLQCICAKCNLRKRDKHPDVWHEEIGWHPTEQTKA